MELFLISALNSVFLSYDGKPYNFKLDPAPSSGPSLLFDPGPIPRERTVRTTIASVIMVLIIGLTHHNQL